MFQVLDGDGGQKREPGSLRHPVEPDVGKGPGSEPENLEILAARRPTGQMRHILEEQ